MDNLLPNHAIKGMPNSYKDVYLLLLIRMNGGAYDLIRDKYTSLFVASPCERKEVFTGNLDLDRIVRCELCNI